MVARDYKEAMIYENSTEANSSNSNRQYHNHWIFIGLPTKYEETFQ